MALIVKTIIQNCIKSLYSSHIALIGLIAFTFSACSSNPIGGNSSLEGDGKDKSELSTGTTDSKGRRVFNAAQLRADAMCPTIEIRDETQAYTLYERGKKGDPNAIRFKGLISQTARECHFNDDKLMIKVGISGRLLAGQKGASGGSFQLPIRVVVVNDAYKPVYSVLHKVPVSITPPATSDAFTKIDDGVILPKANSAGAYRIYVGFDER